ncbi:c-type cytochrome [Roseibacterium sp. SDUM158016]|uniref:c-type cytochrome n=1 Tax=Roseicyclus sediminis TaxID=2980997 RepID=UPI0021D390B5|nr:c-type cytochrome [Roseibacterium sp. SDUM158016]MCU4651406.1 c-type cytochrome [Roseibacterium sp. SDUM158016]
MGPGLRISALALALGVSAGGAVAEGDAARGETLYRPCMACHMIGEGAIHRIGPHLNGIVGRGIGSAEGFSFSDALQEAAARGDAWDEDALDSFLANPRGYLPGTAMVFRGIRSAEDRADLIAYLAEEGNAPAVAAAAATSPAVLAILEIEGDVAYGQYLSSECTSCHIGEGGNDIPSIQGLPPQIFIAALDAYRTGHRHHQVMNTLASRLGDEEIAALAAYFESIAQ